VRSDCLCLACPLQHEQLRQDRDRLKPDGEGPENLALLASPHVKYLVLCSYLWKRVVVWEYKSQHRARAQQVLHLERVEIWVVGGAVVVEHKVDSVGRGGEEDDLEEREVQLRELVKGP
jgi:hypothetical protein